MLGGRFVEIVLISYEFLKISLFHTTVLIFFCLLGVVVGYHLGEASMLDCSRLLIDYSAILLKFLIEDEPIIR